MQINLEVWGNSGMPERKSINPCDLQNILDRQKALIAKEIHDGLELDIEPAPHYFYGVSVPARRDQPRTVRIYSPARHLNDEELIHLVAEHQRDQLYIYNYKG